MFININYILFLFAFVVGSDCKSESDSNTDGEMASNYPHEDASKLGYEKSEETYKEWDKYWNTVQLDYTESVVSMTQGKFLTFYSIIFLYIKVDVCVSSMGSRNSCADLDKIFIQ